MTNQERARRGGQALAAQVSPLYFAWLGRRGGRRTKRNELIAFAHSLAETEPDRAAIWFERAERYHDETGCMVMLKLWTANNCPARSGKRRLAQTDHARWRRWERLQKAA